MLTKSFDNKKHVLKTKKIIVSPKLLIINQCNNNLEFF